MYLDKYRTDEVLRSLEAECAKALNEIKCAQGDLEKANARIRFILAGIHTIKERLIGDKDA